MAGTVDLANLDIGEITMPPGRWIPDPDAPTVVLAALLAIACEVLDQWGMGEAFGRRVFTHGEVTPVYVGDSKTGQVIATLRNAELGRPGQKRFQVDAGELGSYAFVTWQYEVLVVLPWPAPRTGLGVDMQRNSALMAATTDVTKAMWLVLSALRSWSLGGPGSVRTSPPTGPGAQDHVIVGPATPWGPTGTMAGWAVEVNYEYSGGLPR